MKKFSRILLSLLILLGIAAVVLYRLFIYQSPPPISLEDRAKIEIMPLPASLELGKGAFTFSGEVALIFSGQQHPVLQKAIERLTNKKITLVEQAPRSITLQVASILQPIPHKANESYELSVSDQHIRITAPNQIGALHALETIAQLEKEGEIPVCEIKDQARFPWRGLMLDMSRHWMSKELVLRNLDAMAAVHMNVLHMHLTDYQGFRVESKRYPKLHELGAKGDFYTQEDLKEIIQFAEDRGIRVIPEFDLPGHATSWFVGYPELASKPGPYTLSQEIGMGTAVLDPTREEVYAFLDTLFGEMAALFPDEYIHIGGDEVSMKDWDENEEIQKFMQEEGIADEKGLQAYLNQRLQKVLAKHGKKMLGWDEVLHPDLPKEDILIQSWRGQKSLFHAVQGGNEGILSAGWYLDHKLHASQMYKVDPFLLPGAITIEPDSNNWKSWDLTLKFDEEQSLDGQLVLFGEGEELRGYVGLMDRLTSFEHATLEAGKLSTTLITEFGEVSVKGMQEEDSLKGTFSLGLFSLDMTGARSGGSDMPEGIPFPKLEKTKPLTEEDKSRILGGEACMWAEVVDEYTTESRVWPRTAVIAERLWSDPDLANDPEDMYRRLEVMEEYLVERGLQSRVYQAEILRGLITDGDITAISALAEILEEDKRYNRLGIYNGKLRVDFLLNQLVDAARPESPLARRFNQTVANYLEHPEDKTQLSFLTSLLQTWAGLSKALEGKIAPDKSFSEIEKIAERVSQLAEMGLTVLSGEEISGKVLEDHAKILEEAALPVKGVLIAIQSGIAQLYRSRAVFINP